ncbi:hypothetical protein GCM10009688_31690 [Arthrobacter gandavensis]|uniref:Uncharacterized protein n=1 Tax=Arthrobacter gandavensis TaxID=169960 RepID=A0ABP5AZU4_9MICC
MHPDGTGATCISVTLLSGIAAGLSYTEKLKGSSSGTPPILVSAPAAQKLGSRPRPVDILAA